MLYAYFDETFLLEQIGWSKKDGEIKLYLLLIYFTNSINLYPRFLGRFSLNDKPGHAHFFFVAINNALPSTFNSTGQVNSGLSLVLKRMREKSKRLKKVAKKSPLSNEEIKAILSGGNLEEVELSANSSLEPFQEIIIIKEDQFPDENLNSPIIFNP